MRSLPLTEFLRRARKIHGDRYQYNVRTYQSATAKMTIICPLHGSFRQSPFNHLKGHRCNKCASQIAGDKNALSESQVMERLARIHGQRFRVIGEYKRLNTPTQVLCTACGLQRESRLADLLNGDGIACKCSKCYRRNTETFIAEAIETHGAGQYDYTATQFVTVKKPVLIHCNSCDTNFTQTPEIHLMGCGCPKCAQPKGERDVARWLDDNEFGYEIQKKFDTCRHYRLLPFDFYIPSLRTLVEYDGAQHFRAVEWFGGEKAFERTQKRDAIKNKWATEHGYTLIRIRYDESIPEVLTDTLLVGDIAT